jgi:hypothetical protein|nr:hypothetical protein BCU10_04855 [Vibrio splendidus]
MFTAEKVIVYVGTTKLIRDRYLIFYPKPIKYEFGYHYAALSLSFVNIESDVQLFESGVYCCTPILNEHYFCDVSFMTDLWADA